MRTIPPSLRRLALTYERFDSVRVKVIRRSDGWTVDLSNHLGRNWIIGAEIQESEAEKTATFTVRLVRQDGFASLAPFMSGQAQRKDTAPDKVLQPGRVIVVEWQPVVAGGVPTDDEWVEVMRGQIDRIDIGTADDAQLTLECRDESARLIDAWQPDEEHWPPRDGEIYQVEEVIQSILAQGAFDVEPRLPNTEYAIGDLVRPSPRNGFLYRCVAAGESSADAEFTFGTTIGEISEEVGFVDWQCVSTLPASNWQADAAYPEGALVRPPEGEDNGFQYRARVGGISASSPPEFVAAFGVRFPEGGGSSIEWEAVCEWPDLRSYTSSGVAGTPGWEFDKDNVPPLTENGFAPQPYWSIAQQFPVQCGWELRFLWDDAVGRRRPVLRRMGNDTLDVDSWTGSDILTFRTDQFRNADGPDASIEDVRNIVEVVFSNPESQERNRVRRTDKLSVRDYGARWCQVGEASSSSITSTELAVALAERVLRTLSKPIFHLTAELPFFPWLQVGDGLKLLGFSADAEDGHSSDFQLWAGTLPCVVKELSHRIAPSGATTLLTLQTHGSETEAEKSAPFQAATMLRLDTRAGRFPPIVFKRPLLTNFFVFRDGSVQSGLADGAAGLVAEFNAVYRDTVGSFQSPSRFRANVAGIYSVRTRMTIKLAHTDVDAWICIAAAGSIDFVASQPQQVSSTDDEVSFELTEEISLQVGDEVRVRVRTALESETTVYIQPGRYRSSFSVLRLRS